MRVLIVEDEIRIRKGMANLIEGHTAHTVVGEAQNGKEGIEMALLYVPDLIITDIRMPVMDGLEMMEQLRKSDQSWHFVVLSGYSEFEYAKRAIRYGVDDYLIKPLAPDDVIKLLESIEQKLKKERQKTQEKPERMLRNYLVEKENIETETLREVCGYEKHEKLRLICAYVGNLSQEDRKQCTDRMLSFRSSHQQEKLYYFFTESTREFIVMLREDIWADLKRELENKLLARKAKDHIWIWTSASVNGFSELRECYDSLRKLYEYALVIETGEVIDNNLVETLTPQEYAGAKKRKKNLQNFYYKKDGDLFRKEVELFLDETGQLTAQPRQIKEEYVQMVHFLLNLAKENDSRIYEQLQNLNVAQNVGNIVTRSELYNIFECIVQVFLENMTERQNISNYVILRAIDYIRNHYQEGISLESVAENLDITSEYLSTLFNREVGENFTSFLKKFRISHAKKLLKGTDKKIYEIAAEVGYSDPKYFNRVFKEEEGTSPGDFRALNM